MLVKFYQDPDSAEFQDILQARGLTRKKLKSYYRVSTVTGVRIIYGKKETFLIYESDYQQIIREDPKLLEKFQNNELKYKNIKEMYSLEDVQGVYLISNMQEKFLIHDCDLKRILKQWRAAYFD